MVMEWLKRRRNFIVYLGSPGIGKTYFCAAIIPWIYDKVRTFRYWKEGDLLSRIRHGMDQTGDYLGTLKLLIDDELVMIDDLGSSGFNEWRKEVLFHAIDERYESELPTIFTSNLTKKEITEQLGSRASSRLFAKENVVLEFHGHPDKRAEEGI